MRNFWLLLTALLVPPAFAAVPGTDISSMVDPRGAPELIVCSQNLEYFGTYSQTRRRYPQFEKVDYDKKAAALAERMALEKCDVIAVQELVGKTIPEAQKTLESLADIVTFRTNRKYESVAGPTNDKNLRVGFIVAKDRASIVNSVTYYRVELPRISLKEKPRLFPRGPLEIQIRVKGREGTPPRVINLITYHFKSQSQAGEQDAAGLEFETFRMEMAEALRRIVENRHSRSFAGSDPLLVVLGDRNSHSTSASARILEGVIGLADFQGDPRCRLTSQGVALCLAGTQAPQKLFSVLTLDPETSEQPGTFLYEKTYFWLDDIMLPAESLPYAWSFYREEGNYESGVRYFPKGGSDHGLVYVHLNW